MRPYGRLKIQHWKLMQRPKEIIGSPHWLFYASSSLALPYLCTCRISTQQPLFQH
ncbi:hypothetical protein SRABI64_06168 [Pseudomonas carnis]|nr:hypothetical protein SRABI64_06168 [Pseudomonas carnis]